MQNRFLRHTAFLLGLIVLDWPLRIDGDAQGRRRRRSRRVKEAGRSEAGRYKSRDSGRRDRSRRPPALMARRIISTADQTNETEPGTEAGSPKKSSSTKASGNADMQQTINQLSNQVDRLNDKLTQMQQNDRTLIDMERLTRAEQRAESLRAQQVDTESKLADAQSKLEQIDYQLRPENIERAAGYGTTTSGGGPRGAPSPAGKREVTTCWPRSRILETSRTRLETSVATADAEVDTLRQKDRVTAGTAGHFRNEPRAAHRDRSLSKTGRAKHSLSYPELMGTIAQQDLYRAISDAQ